MKKTPKKTPLPSETFPQVITTFMKPEYYFLNQIKREQPTCFNGSVSIKRYRITVEEIQDPTELLCARLQDLWDWSINWHDHDPLQYEAKKLGYELKGRAGNKDKPKE